MFHNENSYYFTRRSIQTLPIFAEAYNTKNVTTWHTTWSQLLSVIYV